MDVSKIKEKLLKFEEIEDAAAERRDLAIQAAKKQFDREIDKGRAWQREVLKELEPMVASWLDSLTLFGLPGSTWGYFMSLEKDGVSIFIDCDYPVSDDPDAPIDSPTNLVSFEELLKHEAGATQIGEKERQG